MITNEVIQARVVEQFITMENSINQLEDLIKETDINSSMIGFYLGKIQENYKNIVLLMEIKFPQI